MISLKNIYRFPKRSLLLFGIAFLLGIMLMFVTFVKGFAEESIGAAVGPLNGCLEITAEDRSNSLNLKNAYRIAESFGVITDAYVSSVNTCNLAGIKSVSPSEEHKEGYGQFDPFALTATTETETLKEFYSGKVSIVEGTGLLRSHNDEQRLAVLVSRPVATLNGLKLGDPIDLDFDVYQRGSIATIRVYVCGIYDVSSTVVQDASHSHLIPSNRVYIPMSVYKYACDQAVEKGSDEIYVSTLYYKVKRPSEALASALQQKVRAAGSGMLAGFTAELFTAGSEVQALYKLSNVLVVAVGAISICFFAVLLALLFWNLRTRMKEIGVYCALGVGRKRVARMITAESLIIFALAFLVGFAAFSFLAIGYGQDIYVALFTSSVGADTEATTLGTYLDTSAKIADAEMIFSGAGDIIVNFALPSAVIAAAVMLGSVVLMGVIFWLYVRKTEVMAIVGGAAE